MFLSHPGVLIWSAVVLFAVWYWHWWTTNGNIVSGEWKRAPFVWYIAVVKYFFVVLMCFGRADLHHVVGLRSDNKCICYDDCSVHVLLLPNLCTHIQNYSFLSYIVSTLFDAVQVGLAYNCTAESLGMLFRSPRRAFPVDSRLDMCMTSCVQFFGRISMWWIVLICRTKIILANMYCAVYL